MGNLVARSAAGFLDNAEEVRRAYAAWLTPSDVLTDLIQSLERPNLTRLVPLALARDLRYERDARLRDAGQVTEKPVYLEDVFVDLPVVEDDGTRPYSPLGNSAPAELKAQDATSPDTTEAEDETPSKIERILARLTRG